MFGFKHWITALTTVGVLHIGAFSLFVFADKAMIERSAGPQFSFVGANSNYAELDAETPSTIESVEAEPDETQQSEKITDVKATEAEVPKSQKVAEAVPEKVDVDNALPVLPSLQQVEVEKTNEPQKIIEPANKPKELNPEKPHEKKAKTEKRKVEKPKKKKKVKKNKRAKNRRKSGKRIAAVRPGGGLAGKQKLRAGKAAISNFRGRVRAHLARHQRPPSTGRIGRRVVTVRFSISASGRVKSVRLVRRSGVAAIDREGLSMVRRASPFPAIPPGMPRSMIFTIPITFKQ